MVTLTSANSALKTMYLDVVANQLNSNIHPFLAKVEKTSQDVVGKLVKKLVPYGVNGGIGAGTESGSLPSVAENNYALFEVALKNLYGSIEISDKAIRASSNEAGAFLNLLSAEMEGLVEASKFNLARMLYGNGNGLLATGTATASGAYTFTVDSMKNLMVGQVVDIYVDGVYKATTRIVGWDYATKTLTFSDACTAEMVAENEEGDGEDAVVELYVQGSKGKEITGIGSIFDSSITTLYGLTKADYPFLTPITQSVASASFSEADLMSVIDACEEQSGGEINFICGSYDARRNFQNLFKNNRLNLDVTKLEGGYTTISFNGIPFIAERFIDDGTIYFLNSDNFKMHQLGDWQWIENDKGQILRQKEGYPIHTATLVKYAELVCDKPGAQGKLTITAS